MREKNTGSEIPKVVGTRRNTNFLPHCAIFCNRKSTQGQKPIQSKGWELGA